MGTYEYQDNPYINSYDNYRSLDVNYEQYLPPPLPVPPAKPKSSRNKQQQQQQQQQPHQQQPDQPNDNLSGNEYHMSGNERGGGVDNGGNYGQMYSPESGPSSPQQPPPPSSPESGAYEMHNGGPGNNETPMIFYSNE